MRMQHVALHVKSKNTPMYWKNSQKLATMMDKMGKMVMMTTVSTVSMKSISATCLNIVRKITAKSPEQKELSVNCMDFAKDMKILSLQEKKTPPAKSDSGFVALRCTWSNRNVNITNSVNITMVIKSNAKSSS